MIVDLEKLDTQRRELPRLRYTVELTEHEYIEVCRVVMAADLSGGVSLNTKRAIVDARYERVTS